MTHTIIDKRKKIDSSGTVIEEREIHVQSDTIEKCAIIYEQIRDNAVGIIRWKHKAKKEKK